MRGNRGTMVVGPWTIDIEQEMREVESGEQPEKQWRWIDGSGHGHFWADGYPTLKRVEFNCSCLAVDEDHTDWRLECPHCGEVIRPAMRPSRPEAVPGRLRVMLMFEGEGETRIYDGFTDQEGRAIINDPIEAIPRLTADRTPASTEYRSSR